MSAPITIIGNLVADPEITFGKSGKAITKFRVATSKRVPDGDGQWKDTETTYWKCTAFGALGEAMTDHLAKGNAVIVQGRVYDNTWTTPEGEKRHSIEVIAEHVGQDLRRPAATKTRQSDAVADVWGTSGNDADIPF